MSDNLRETLDTLRETDSPPAMSDFMEAMDRIKELEQQLRLIVEATVASPFMISTLAEHGYEIVQHNQASVYDAAGED